MFRSSTLAIRNQQGSAAVEFALTLPCLALVLFATVGYGIALAMLHSVQQLAAEAARASVPGLTSQDREALARNFISQNVAGYPLLDPAKLTVVVSDGSAPTYTFSVSVSLDLSGSFLSQFRSLVPLPTQVTRLAAIRRGGF